MPKTLVGGALKARVRNVMEQAVESGIRVGYARAHKHNEKPEQEAIIGQIIDSVIESIDEWFLFDDDAALQ